MFEFVSFQKRFRAALGNGNKSERKRVFGNGKSAGDFVFNELFFNERCFRKNVLNVGQNFHLAADATFHLFFGLPLFAKIEIIINALSKNCVAVRFVFLRTSEY